MPYYACVCGKKISYEGIPCENEWLLLADTEFDKLSNNTRVGDVYPRMISALRCMQCRRLWIFWRGYGADPEELISVTASYRTSQ